MPSNTFGSLNAALIAQRGLELLVTNFPLIGAIVTDFSDSDVHYGQTITTRIPTIGSVRDYDSGNAGYNATGAVSSDVSVLLDKYKHASFDIDDAAFSATNRNLVEDYAVAFSAALGAQIMSDIAALWTSGNYPHGVTGLATTGNRGSLIIDPKKDMSKRYIYGDLVGVFNCDAYYQLFKDTSIVDVGFKGVGISSATLPTVHGVSLSEYADLPTSQNLCGVIMRKDAVIFAARPPSDAGFADLPQVGRITKVTEPKTGLTIQTREFYDMRLGRRQVTFTLIYGCAKGQVKSLERLQTS